MKLVTYERRGRRRLGALVDGRVVDLPGLVGHPAFPSSMEALIARPRGTVMDAARAALERTEEIPEWTVRRPTILAPIVPPAVAEEDHRWVVGPGTPVQRPPGNGDTRFDVELAAVIFRPKKPKLKASEAESCIFGYTLMQSWFTPNGFAAALGPCLVTRDEFDATGEIQARINHRDWSSGTLGDIAVPFGEQIVRAAKREELLPGEVFGSGTLGLLRQRRPPRGGAEVVIEHPSIGTLTNVVGPRLRTRRIRAS